ncbi:hypothetical protein TSTA_033790 [Talaromyces stipitatus ATCC 10500]|uniref:Ankyrin repeat protein n=1 Tax=Talaromyces stipitatus (strain ATCC 10500 / CBS 375.48 / QM 6759 / NRRL 1006) TaxID=441959 RepID=B8M6R7_TALSN|nr:uncharacterized protein TSTA_033790 [Talaromyces stipitatus ATCC 10500]EED20137.1 hypothetical protein TSTA_033790 [Talaromyces stipitatus ATCC 10500]
MNSSASRQSRYDSVRIMLSESSADWSSHYRDGQREPLQTAVRLGDLEMCSLLISHGKADPLSALPYDSEPQVGLKDNCPEDEEKAVVQILQLLCEYADREVSHQGNGSKVEFKALE